MFTKIAVLALVSLSFIACSTSPQKVSHGLSERSSGDLGSFHLSDAVESRGAHGEFDDIPSELNPMVDKWVGYFQGRGRPHMERYLSRSTRYEKLMKKVLRDEGLPEDIFYIALIESGFSSRAVSHASAVGYWQFIRGTGKRYGLEISRLVDERRDPVMATQAAAEYFKGLYSVFGSWYLAMASYNAGENRVKREVMKHTTRDFWELAHRNALPKETLNYIPKFIAARLIAKNPEKYGFEGLDYHPPIEFDSVAVLQPVNLRTMADKMNYNYEDFKDLNPKFKGEIASMPNSGPLILRIPVGQKELALQAANESTVDKVEFVADTGDTQSYKIRRGDTLNTIARRFRTNVAYLRDLNDIPKGKRLKVGSVVYVPDRTPLKERGAKTTVAKNNSEKENSASKVEEKNENLGSTYHIVQKGESLFTIANRYGLSLAELRRLNNMESSGKILKLGAKLRVTTQEEEQKKSASGSGTRVVRKKVHVVQKGETLQGIAEKYNVKIADLKKKNRIRNPASLVAGAKLSIPSGNKIQ